MSDPICDICRKPIEPGAKTAALGDHLFHVDCLKDGAERTIARALTDAKLGKPQ
jgi:hypothetical protein